MYLWRNSASQNMHEVGLKPGTCTTLQVLGPHLPIKNFLKSAWRFIVFMDMKKRRKPSIFLWHFIKIHLVTKYTLVMWHIPVCSRHRFILIHYHTSVHTGNVQNIQRGRSCLGHWNGLVVGSRANSFTLTIWKPAMGNIVILSTYALIMDCFYMHLVNICTIY